MKIFSEEKDSPKSEETLLNVISEVEKRNKPKKLKIKVKAGGSKV